MLEHERTIAIETLRDAARIARVVQSEITPGRWDKEDRTPVTVADFAVQALVSGALQEHFPHDPFMAEEGADELRLPAWSELLDLVAAHVHLVHDVKPDRAAILNAIDRGQQEFDPGQRYWILDPVDGTKGFLRKEQYAIALALVERGNILLGVLACPNLTSDAGVVFCDPLAPRGQILAAVQGGGAECFDLHADGTLSSPRPIRVSPESDPALARWCERVETSSGNKDRTSQIVTHAGITAEPFRIDSQAKYAVVARGDAVLYLRHTLDPLYREKVWDHAAGVLIVEEAGGKVTDLAGRKLDFTQGRQLSRNRGIVATNGLLHDRILAAVRTVLGSAAESH